MGHRANYVIVGEEGYELYYSHWGSNVVDRDFIWGPEAAVDFIRAQQPTREWLDERWCEGGALIDEKARLLLLFGGEEIRFDPFAQRVYLKLLGCAWPGWELRWAYEGILEMTRYLGLCDEIVAVPEMRQRQQCHKEDLLEGHDTLVCWQGEKFSLQGWLPDLLDWGPALLDHFPSRRTLHADPPIYFLWIESGLIRYFGANDHPFLLEQSQERWPGWKFQLDPDLLWLGTPPASENEMFEQMVQRLQTPISSRAESFASAAELLGAESVNPLGLRDARSQIGHLPIREYRALPRLW